MTKSHFCSKFTKEGVICGDKNPENFNKGRYSICKKCKTNEVNEYRQKQKMKELGVSMDISNLSTEKNMKKAISELIEENTLLKYEISDMRVKYNNIIMQMYNDMILANNKISDLQGPPRKR